MDTHISYIFRSHSENSELQLGYYAMHLMHFVRISLLDIKPRFTCGESIMY